MWHMNLYDVWPHEKAEIILRACLPLWWPDPEDANMITPHVLDTPYIPQVLDVVGNTKMPIRPS
eukprot:1693635-Amphidinium_carterae.1